MQPRRGVTVKLARLSSLAVLALVALANLNTRATAQTTYTWNNTGTTWTAAGSWTPVTGSGTTFPGDGTTDDTAQFNVLGTFGTATQNNPVLNSAITLNQLSMAGNANFTGWSLTGSGGITAGSASVNGLYARGFGSHVINLGDGTTTSLNLNGPTGTSGGAMNIGTSSTVILTGNTVVNTGATRFAIRGGTLVLDNSLGNPTSQRLTSSGLVNLNGGGSTIEFRGAASGTTFNGLTGQLEASGSGDTFVRTVANGAAELNVSFASMRRTNNAGFIFFENIGNGFVGDTGNSVRLTMNTDPGGSNWFVNSGMISTSGANPLGYALVTNKASAGPNEIITGRWANYVVGTGVVAVSTTDYSGNVTIAPSENTGVLFSPTVSGSYTYDVLDNPRIQSITFEPTASNVSLAIGAGINTNNILLSGDQDMRLTGTNVFGGTAGTRNIVVLNPDTTLTTTASFNIITNTPVVVGGHGFVALDGTGNMLGSPGSSTNLVLSGGTLRGKDENLVFNGGGGVNLRFRGGVLEYDVSSGNATFGLALGTSAGTVNWTSNAGNTAATNVGGGGFSAYSTNPANSLTVNIGGLSEQLEWNSASQFFVTDGYALKFGSTQSNATLRWQNPIALDDGAAGDYRVREINVTRGAGTAADKTIFAGAITGSASTDLLKTGNGAFELISNSTYVGNTLIQGGRFIVAARLGDGSNPTGNVVVGNGATLAGLTASGVGPPPTIYGNSSAVIHVNPGGAIRGGNPNDTVAPADRLGTLSTNTDVVLRSDSTNQAILRFEASRTGAGTANASKISVTDQNPQTTKVFNFNIGSNGFIIDLVNGANSLTIGESYQVDLLTVQTAGNIQLNGSPQLANAIIPPSSYTLQSSAFAFEEVDLLVSSNGLALQLSFTPVPVPEPATVLGIAGAALGLGGFIRRRLRKNTSNATLTA